MGLMAIARKLRRQDQFKEDFEEIFGMSVEEAKKLLVAKKEATPVAVDKETKQKFADDAKKHMSPEQLVEAFSDDVEEFYPNGKPKSTNN